ncbi:uncharacterized protein UV8b_03434 [Ustilaginoidea virens]|uniref:Uncharacterized protein n=1 Tax=Ustilaginoidea virens TaxID=1159556 RepID=A0A8E5HPV7_USTVR|nr:uncharacterized protein UV8b_03434 [Ustilaginoidea virens]QUC19193.1 hypothetical protein UV8b_03434 [Ustilaginoidea virens]
MKADILVAAALASLAVAAPASTLFRRDPLLELSANSLPDKAAREVYKSNVWTFWRAFLPGARRLPVMVHEYAARLQDIINRGEDELASDIILDLANSANSKEYPVSKEQLDLFLETLSQQMDWR